MESERGHRRGLAAWTRSGTLGPMSVLLAWLVLIVFFVLPLVHVAVSPKAGPWLPPPGARCPFGPRVGWLVLVLFLGPIGWLMFLASRRLRPVNGPRS